MNKAFFLDRDGIINKAIIKEGKPFSPRKFKEFKLKKGIKNLLREFKEMGFLNIVVSNQPDITRGLMKMEELEKMVNFIRKKLLIDDIIICFHDDIDNCQCRKPKPGMLKKAAKKWKINLKKSFMLGDGWKDIEAGERAGCRTILLKTSYNLKVDSDFKISSLAEILDIIK